MKMRRWRWRWDDAKSIDVEMSLLEANKNAFGFVAEAILIATASSNLETLSASAMNEMYFS